MFTGSTHTSASLSHNWLKFSLGNSLDPGKSFLTPFCGSGTTLVQANELGMHSIGYDISAFNRLLCEAKTARYDVANVKREILDALTNVRSRLMRQEEQGDLWESSGDYLPLTETDSEYLKQWFAPTALKELITYREEILSGPFEYKELLRVILSRSARSARLTKHFDLDFPKRPQTEPYDCYKHSRICSPTQEAYKFLQRYSLDTIRRVSDFADRRTSSWVIVTHADSRKVDPPCIIDGVITSPPYVGLIDYHEQHAYGYHLLGLEDKRGEEIGPAVNGSGQKARDKYIEDISEVFSRSLKMMPVGGRMIVVAADRANLYSDISMRIGVEVEAILQRHVNRRTGRRTSEFYESVFVWKKV
jgi:hypothetical protein